jgi:hypothetical protein
MVIKIFIGASCVDVWTKFDAIFLIELDLIKKSVLDLTLNKIYDGLL